MRMAKARGHLRGGTPKLNARQGAHLTGLYRTGQHSVSDLQDLFGVTRSTVYRAIRRTRDRELSPIAGGSTEATAYRGRHGTR
jgi:DNA invertase Pin-like site-specific DNA recombinase